MNSDQNSSAPPPIGRPPLFSQALADQVCQHLSEGKSLRKACQEPGMPTMTTVLKWAIEIPSFTEQYTRARAMLLEFWAEDVIDISDDGRRDYKEEYRPDGSSYIQVDHDHINRSRLRVDSRKWILSKLAARKYGEKTAVEMTGANGDPLIPVESKEDLVKAIIDGIKSKPDQAPEKA